MEKENNIMKYKYNLRKSNNTQQCIIQESVVRIMLNGYIIFLLVPDPIKALNDSKRLLRET